MAIRVTGDDQAHIRARLEQTGYQPSSIEHGYVQSLHLHDPDGLRVELSSDPPDSAEVARWRREDAHSVLARWMAGDRAQNNALRAR